MSYLLMIGTRKGLFRAESEDRRDWEVSGPLELDADHYTDAMGFYALGIDPHTRRVLVGAEHMQFGPGVWHSDDLGRTWTEPDTRSIAFPDDVEDSLVRAWQFAYTGEPGVVYAGAEPHSLFRSDDGGEHFTLVRSLWDHPHRANWFPGAGGAAIHTVLPGRVGGGGDGADAMTVAMSTGGVYQTRDGGASWAPANRGIYAGFLPGEEPEYGQCVHKVSIGPDGAFYAQNHHGVYRSTDPAAGWDPIAAGLPTDFGFAMVAHPHRSGEALNFPVISEARHLPPGFRLTPYRTGNGGESWQAADAGLPGSPYYGIVLRDGAATDGAAAPGFYFGTRSGDVYAAVDRGNGVGGPGSEWMPVATDLPDVLCVRAAEV